MVDGSPPDASDAHVLTEEVRVAMALNGGVSLAVWMGGCAVELDAARRAHLGPEALDVGEAAPQPTVPSRLAQFALGAPKPAPAPPPPEQPRVRRIYNGLCEAFARELVIDLMSGASAGGINGAMLGCVTVHGRRLHPDFVRRKWLELGDISLLLHRTSKPDPRSLMRGREFHANLRKTFDALTGDPQGDADAQDLAQSMLPDLQATRKKATGQPDLEPSLDVTTTDLDGTERTYQDAWGGELVAREYRARFAFREKGDYDAASLATAARSSASFPFAFEPWLVKDDKARGLAGFGGPRFVIDGGLLDNAPIKVVLDLIPEQPAARQVSRYVCYLNADPPASEQFSVTLEKQVAAKKPPVDVEEQTEDGPPSLFDLAKTCATLPKKAPFVDQLDAIARRTRRSKLAHDTEVVLLGASDEELRPLALTLLALYRQRRRLLSLEELLEHPKDVRRAWQRIEGAGGLVELPWVPVTVDEDPRQRWGWGLRAAQRTIHLLLDALRLSISNAKRTRDLDRLKRLLDARGAVSRSVADLADERAALLGDSAIRRRVASLAGDEPVTVIVDRLTKDWRGKDQAAADAVRDAATTVLRVVDDLIGDELQATGEAPGASRPIGERLFGRGLTVDAFIQRARYVEVIRRAFDTELDIDTPQRVGFVQLTPFTKVLIFQAPGDAACPESPDDKLTGIQLGHFAAFYRRSWRSNDYMWGRLDASTRIVELLVDAGRARELAGYTELVAPWDRLTELLLKDATPDQTWLIWEALPDELPEPTDPEALREPLRNALKADLKHGDGDLTRRICQRAVQLEILEQELPTLNAASTDDRRLGASSPALDLELGPSIRAAVTKLRPATGEQSLPERLDARGKMEIGSTLGLRVATHALFVVLAALRNAKLPFATALYLLRALLFPVAGAVSRIGWYRVATAAGFWSAALYVTSRVVTTCSGGCTVKLGDVLSRPVLLTYVALLAVIGIVAMPALRAWAGGRLRWRLAQMGWGLLLAALGGGVAIALALTAGGVDTADLLFTAQSDAEPWNPLQWALVALVFALPVARIAPFVRHFIFRQLVRWRWVGAAIAGTFLALTIVLALWSIFGPLRPALTFDTPWWETLAAYAAAVGALLAVSGYLAASWLDDKARSGGGRSPRVVR